MDTNEMDYDGLRLLSSSIASSRYIFYPADAAKLVSWQIAMADNTVRDILFSEMNSKNDLVNVGSRIFFNAKSIMGGAEAMAIEDLPWTKATPLEKHVAKSLAKKRLRVSDDLRVIDATKSAGKISLELLNEGAIGFGQLQDSKIWIGTPNEEEGLSFIFGNKTQRSAMVMRKSKIAGNVEISFLSDIPTEIGKSTTNGDMQSYTIIPPDISDTFSAEILAY